MTELAARLVPRTWPRTSTLLVLALLVAVALPYVRMAQYRGDVLPGTTVAGIDVSGLDEAEATAVLQRRLAPRLKEPVQVRVGETTVAVKPSDVLALNAVATADAAVAASRGTEPARFAALVGLRHVKAAPVLRERPEGLDAALAQIRKAGGHSATAAELEMSGVEPVVTPGREGLRLDASALLADLRRATFAGGAVTAHFAPSLPRYSTEDARRAADVARSLVAAPVYVFFEGRPLRTLAPEELARLVDFERRAGDFLVTLDEPRLARVLDPAIGVHERRAVNARFEITGDRVRVLPDRPGIGLDKGAALAEVTAAAYSPDRRVADIRLTELPAEIQADALTSLGITRKISSFTTDMGVSSSNRIWNVQLMARYIDGTIIKPGEVFSFNRVVGERTVERGFREGQMIVGSLLLPSIGGGVCQTATTLFNNAFELGLPIVERHNHSFYISHYPLGRDATVNYPNLDLRFVNDTDGWIVVHAGAGGSGIFVSLFGVDTGRRVESTPGPLRETGPPRLEVERDPAMLVGQRIVESEGEPSRAVSVERVVYDRDGTVRRRETWSTTYRSEAKIVRVGTKPKPEPPKQAKPDKPKQPATTTPSGTTTEPAPDEPPPAG